MSDKYHFILVINKIDVLSKDEYNRCMYSLVVVLFWLLISFEESRA